MSNKTPATITFRGRTYRRVQAQQLHSVYVGTIYAEETTPYDNPAYGTGVDVGPTSAVAVLAARDLNKLKSGLETTEASILHGLQKAPTDWQIRLFTEIKAQDMGEFEHQIRQEWTNAEQILRDVHMGKTVVLENVIDELFMEMP
jgi:hypothetical protein